MTPDEEFMAAALNEAVKAFGCTSPNPLVGACIVKDNIIIGKSNNKALASTGGAENISANVVFDSLTTENATLSTAQLASHSHSGTAVGTPSPGPGKIAVSSGPGPYNVPAPAFATASIGSAGSGDGHSHNIAISNAAANVVGSVLQPYIVTLYIIKT